MMSRDHVYDSGSGGLYEDNSKYPNQSHVHSVSFDGTNLAIGGSYNVSLMNNDMAAGTAWTLNISVYGVVNQSSTKTCNYSVIWYYDFDPYLVLPLNENSCQEWLVFVLFESVCRCCQRTTYRFSQRNVIKVR
jgi:hypothetical protein